MYHVHRQACPVFSMPLSSNDLAQFSQQNMDDVVISGISGRLPESDNLDEFWNHLINKDNLVTEDNRRWEQGMILYETVFGIKDGIEFEVV